jgi:hypothetical protein
MESSNDLLEGIFPNNICELIGENDDEKSCCKKRKKKSSIASLSQLLLHHEKSQVIRFDQKFDSVDFNDYVDHIRVYY